MKALRIFDEDDGPRGRMSDLEIDDLTAGDVVIKTRYSSLNYKDALAITGAGKIVRKPPLNAGIDVAGTVESSENAGFAVGDEVLVTGWGLSETRDGGLAEYVRVPADCVTARPEGLSLWQTMALGTAGFTAAMAIKRMRDNFQRPEHGPILVTGATGGVGMFAIDMLAQAGFEPVAVTRKADAQADALRALGAVDVITPDALDLDGKPMGKPVYGGAIDAVGGKLLAQVLGQVAGFGNVASIGLAGSPKLETMVLPFILRGVSLLGINSVECPTRWRNEIWAAIDNEHRPMHIETIAHHTIGFEDVFAVCDEIMEGSHLGRAVVEIGA